MDLIALLILFSLIAIIKLYRVLAITIEALLDMLYKILYFSIVLLYHIFYWIFIAPPIFMYKMFVLIYMILIYYKSKNYPKSEIGLRNRGVYSIVYVKNIGLEYYTEYLGYIIARYWTINNKIPESLNCTSPRSSNSIWKGLLSVYSLYSIHKNYIKNYKHKVYKINNISFYKLKLRIILKLRNRYENSIETKSIISVMKSYYNVRLFDNSIDDDRIFYEFTNDVLEKKGLIGLLFNNKSGLIDEILNPSLGCIYNLSKNRYYFYLSIGSNFKKRTNNHTVCDINEYCIRFDKLSINIGYDNTSYVVYVFNNNIQYKKGDSLVFKGDNDTVYIQMKTEKIYYDGEFSFEFLYKECSSILLDKLLNKRNFSFKIIRISKEELSRISQIVNLGIFFHSSDSDNYYKLNGDNKWNVYVSNEQVFQHLITSLPQKELQV